MSIIPKPLRYRISSWYQLTKCESNNSRHLHIHVSDIFQKDILEGVRISVEHDNLGTLFAIVLSARGALISPESLYDVNMSVEGILKELHKYGFFVEYTPTRCLPGSLLSYLMTLQKLKFDKLRILSVTHRADYKVLVEPQIVVFFADKCPKWLNNTYIAQASEIDEAAGQGYALNISAVPEVSQYDWSWLQGWVASIEDVLNENSLVGKGGMYDN